MGKRSPLRGAKRGVTMNVVNIITLKRAIALSEEHPHLRPRRWMTKTLATFDNFDRGVAMLLQGTKLRAFGLWAIAAEAAGYGAMMSPYNDARLDYPRLQMLRIHRLLYAVAFERYGEPFVALNNRRQLRVMRAALLELQGEEDG